MPKFAERGQTPHSLPTSSQKVCFLCRFLVSVSRKCFRQTEIKDYFFKCIQLSKYTRKQAFKKSSNFTYFLSQNTRKLCKELGDKIYNFATK